MALAVLHATSFEPGWSEDSIGGFLTDPACLTLGAREHSAAPFDGMLLLRIAGDEAEILTLAVAPHARRQGLGRQLVETAIPLLSKRNVNTLFLEFAADNHAAALLYKRIGFCEAGRREGYYKGTDGTPRRDARILRLDMP